MGYESMRLVYGEGGSKTFRVYDIKNETKHNLAQYSQDIAYFKKHGQRRPNLQAHQLLSIGGVSGWYPAKPK
jgi:hypothetical protein